MKKILLALCALLPLFALPAHASFTINQVLHSQGTTTTTLSITIPSGHTVVVWTYGEGGVATQAAVTDSGGNTYTVGNSDNIFGQDTAGTQVSIAIPVGITSVTYTPTGTPATNAEVVVWDITATGPIGLADSKAVAYPFNSTPGTDALTTGTLTITGTDAIILGAARDGTGDAVVAGTGFTNDITVTSSFIGEHKAVSASAACTFTGAGTGDLVVTAALALQIVPPTVTNGVVMSGGHPVKSGTSILYK